MKYQIKILFLLIVLFMNLTSYGQNVPDSTRTFRIETKDGNIFTGSVITQDSICLVLKTATLGEIRILLTEIQSKTELKDVVIVKNKIWLPNPQSGRYFWAPDGYGLEKDKSYYQNIWVLYNQFSYGMTNNFSLGAGLIPLFLFAGAPTPVWIVPKISIPVIRDKINVGTGAFLGTLLGEGSGAFGLVYGTTTFGSRDKNLSLGFAWGFSSGEWMTRPIINFSAMIRTGPKSYLITENYIIPVKTEVYSYAVYPGGSFENKYKSVVIISLGGRSIIRNVGLDYSIWIPFNADIGEFVAIPFLGVTIPLGK
jgi:hypothetical protein